MIAVMEVTRSLNFATMPLVLLINSLARMVAVFLFIGFAMGIMFGIFKEIFEPVLFTFRIVMMQLMRTQNVVLQYNVGQINSDVRVVVNAYH